MPVRVVADVAYCNATLQRGHDPRVVFVGTMRPDAVLTALPTTEQRKKTGRRRVKGSVMPKPEKLAVNARKPWQAARATLYGKERVVHIKTMRAQWYIACGGGLLHIILVRLDHGRIPFRTFFSSDPGLDAVDILEAYARRWSIEVAFRNLMQHRGFADSPARLRRAVERTAPFVGLLYTSLVLWFLEHAAEQPLALVPVRTWYRHKTTLSFEDVLRAARTDPLLPVSDPLRPSDNLKNGPDTPKSPPAYRSRP